MGGEGRQRLIAQQWIPFSALPEIEHTRHTHTHYYRTRPTPGGGRKDRREREWEWVTAVGKDREGQR